MSNNRNIYISDKNYKLGEVKGFLFKNLKLDSSEIDDVISELEKDTKFSRLISVLKTVKNKSTEINKSVEKKIPKAENPKNDVVISSKALKEKAIGKIEEEHKDIKEKILKNEPETIYNYAAVISFTEAVIYILKQLTVDMSLCTLIIKEGKTLECAVEYVMSKVRNKYGIMGDLPIEEFHNLLWDYYKIEPVKAKAAMAYKPTTSPIAKVSKRKKSKLQQSMDLDNLNEITASKPVIESKPIKEPQKPKNSVQFSLFDLLGGEN